MCHGQKVAIFVMVIPPLIGMFYLYWVYKPLLLGWWVYPLLIWSNQWEFRPDRTYGTPENPMAPRLVGLEARVLMDCYIRGFGSRPWHSGHSGRFWCQIIHTIHGTNGIFTYMAGWFLWVNVCMYIYTIHGWYGSWTSLMHPCNINVLRILNGAWFVHEPRWHTPTSFGKLQYKPLLLV